jgi:transposase
LLLLLLLELPMLLLLLLLLLLRWRCTMGAPYSLDLRERAVAFATEYGELSQGQVAAFFSIGEATLQRWLREYRETGDLAPKPHTGGHDPLVSLEGAELLSSIVRRENDRTLEEYCRLLEEAGGPRLARSTMYDTLERLGITRKKKRSTQLKGTGPTSSRHGASSRRREPASTPSGTSSSTSRG